MAGYSEVDFKSWVLKDGFLVKEKEGADKVRLRNIIPLSIAILSVGIILIIFSNSQVNQYGFASMLALSFILGDVVYVLSLFVTYMLIKPDMK
ncbi:MAG: hypothetical protein JSV74_06580 [Dehalococcoidia bacterium]|nr:MAG: hypothetical protein JSV74_06580 [Dehalococcoidia bacterium]